MLNAPPARPLSAVEYRTTAREDQPMSGLISHEAAYAQDDIDMADAGPSTAPPHATGPRSFLMDD
jgi:F-box and WD-40 domain protein CDC4